MTLESLTDWITFFASEDKIFDYQNWTISVMPYSDTKATLLFEKFSHRTPSGENPVKILQFIISPAPQENKLWANMLFLAEQGFSLTRIITSLDAVLAHDNGEVLTGSVGSAKFTLMEYSAYE